MRPPEARRLPGDWSPAQPFGDRKPLRMRAGRGESDGARRDETMTFEDWRDADAAVVRDSLRSKKSGGGTTLGWDTDASWAIVEEGRRRGNVPGWILRSPSGDVCGWTYYLLFDGELQIGGLIAERATDLRCCSTASSTRPRRASPPLSAGSSTPRRRRC